MARLILKIVELFLPIIATNLVVHTGRVIIVSPIDLRTRTTVITPDGIGEIQMVILDFISKKPLFADVYLYRGYLKRYRVLSLQQYVVFHKPIGQFIKLSPANYRYVYENKQLIEYRVTNRHYAQLTDKSKEEYKFVKALNKMRYGLSVLKVLLNQGLEIKRKE